jgi:hypothetical protein
MILIGNSIDPSVVAQLRVYFETLDFVSSLAMRINRDIPQLLCRAGTYTGATQPFGCERSLNRTLADSHNERLEILGDEVNE